MESIKDILKEHNLKASSARLLLLEKLRPEQAHFTAEELFNSLRTSLPGLSLATIYKNLEDLREAGILRMVTLPNQVRQYEWERGDHMHVVEGNQVRDLEDQALFDRIRNMIAEKMGPDFEVETIDVQIFGKQKSTATL